MKKTIVVLLAVMMTVALFSFCVNAEENWTAIAIDDAAVSYEAPGGGAISEKALIEGASLCTVIPAEEGAFCEVKFKGTGIRLYMLCNVQEGGAKVYNAPALDAYVDGKYFGRIEMTDNGKFGWKNAADLVWEIKCLSDADHTVKFVNTTYNDYVLQAAYFMGFEYYTGATELGLVAATAISETQIVAQFSEPVEFNANGSESGPFMAIRVLNPASNGLIWDGQTPLQWPASWEYYDDTHDRIILTFEGTNVFDVIADTSKGVVRFGMEEIPLPDAAGNKTDVDDGVVSNVTAGNKVLTANQTTDWDGMWVPININTAYGDPVDPTPADPADPTPSTPATADIAVVLALMAAASGAGLAFGKKRK